MKKYSAPTILSAASFETSALRCAKVSSTYSGTYPPPAGSHHFTSAYDTFTGHLGPGFGADSSMSPDQRGVGWGPGGTSQSYGYVGLCNTWVLLSS